MQQSYYRSQGLGIDILQTAIVSAILVFGSNIDRIISKSLGEKNSGFPSHPPVSGVFATVKHFPVKMHEVVALQLKPFEKKNFLFHILRNFKTL